MSAAPLHGPEAPALAPRDRVQIALAWAGWFAAAIVMAALVARRPEANSVTVVYRQAAAAYFAGEPMYAPGLHGWLYPPHAALLYAPFAALPLVPGEVLYRLVATGLLAWAVWRLAVLASPRGRGDYFPMMTLLVLPASLGALRNGQMNVPLAATMTLATVQLARGATWPAAAWLALGTMVKPMGVVPALLAAGVRWRLILPIALVVTATLALPWLFGGWPYVLEQHHAALAKMREAGDPPPGTFADLTGLLWSIGVTPPPAVLTALRLVAAPITLGLAWLAVRRRPGAEGWVLTLALAATYLMLFNPRTEGVSYPILMPPLAALACWAVFRDRRVVVGSLLLVLAVVMAIAHVFSRGGDVVLRPFGACVFAGVVGWWILARAAPPARGAGGPPGPSAPVA